MRVFRFTIIKPAILRIVSDTFMQSVRLGSIMAEFMAM